MIITDYVYPELRVSSETLFNNDIKTILDAPVYPQAVIMPMIAGINSNKEATERGGK